MAKNIPQKSAELPPQEVVQDPVKRRVWVIYRLMLMGMTLADVARSANVERTTLYHAFLRPYPRMELAIAQALGLKPEQLFPERYDRHGLPAKRGTKVHGSYHHGGKDNPKRVSRNLQAKAAA